LSRKNITKKISLLIVLCLITLPCFAWDFRVEEPYRIYYADTVIDWFDVVAVLNHKFEVIFEDKSPIVEVRDHEYYRYLTIEKENSYWILEYGTDELDFILRLADPDLSEYIPSKVIYSR